MKVMWLCNAPIPQVAKACKISNTIHEGWLISVATELERRDDVQFVFVMLSDEVSEGIHYVKNMDSLYVMINLKDQSKEMHVKAFSKILKEVNPDLVHIWGTEYKHSWAMVQAAKEENRLESVVVSMQGLVHMYSYHYMGGIPGKYQVIPSFRDVLRKDSIKKQKKNMVQRGKLEKETFKLAKHVIGRTFWDKACAKLLNPEISYHFNNETLRENFYNSVWKYEDCKKHSIFVSQSHYPIKGFHYLLEAVAILKEDYPDISVYVSGHKNALKTGILSTSYGKYLQYLIKKHNLSSCIHYVGLLNAEEMKKQFLSSEIFVSPSVIENSPNSVGEGMLLGMPVISSNVGGVSDMLLHNQEGYLYQADAPYMLAYYIREFFENQEKEVEYGKNARNHALKTHDKEENMRKLIEIYECVSKKGVI